MTELQGWIIIVELAVIAWVLFSLYAEYQGNNPGPMTQADIEEESEKYK